MKKVLIFIAGIIIGAVLTFLILNVFSVSSSSHISHERYDGITMFDKAGDCISNKEFEIFQVLEPDMALACEESFRGETVVSYAGMVVLFVNDEGRYYYDDEIIKIPSGKCVRQVGIYKYSTQNGYKTVPVVKVME